MFLSLSAIVYLVVAFLLTWIMSQQKVKDKIFTKGLLIGGAVGFCIYLIAFTLGVSFSQNGIEHIVVDFIWQMTEQGIGGGVIGILYAIYHRQDRMLEKA